MHPLDGFGLSRDPIPSRALEDHRQHSGKNWHVQNLKFRIKKRKIYILSNFKKRLEELT